MTDVEQYHHFLQASDTRQGWPLIM